MFELRMAKQRGTATEDVTKRRLDTYSALDFQQTEIRMGKKKAKPMWPVTSNGATFRVCQKGWCQIYGFNFSAGKLILA